MSKEITSASRSQTATQWDAELYDNKHAFVAQFGTDLVKLLSPQAGEVILDLGCGTGHLTHKIAATGAKVTGIDYSSTMIEQAKTHYPTLNFEVGDATDLRFSKQFDAVFSNAALHWIKEPEKVIQGVWQALKPGGRFVAEFGGKGNIKTIVTAIQTVVQARGYPTNQTLHPWYFPSIAEYGSLLEKQGFQFTFAHLFDRRTMLEDGEAGIRNWIEMFANSFLQTIPVEDQSNMFLEIENQLRPSLYQNGTWVADYRRLRIIATK